MTTHGRKELTSSPVSALVAGYGVHKRASMTSVVRRPNLLVTKGTAMTERSDSMKTWKDRVGYGIRVDARGIEGVGKAGSRRLCRSPLLQFGIALMMYPYCMTLPCRHVSRVVLPHCFATASTMHPRANLAP